MTIWTASWSAKLPQGHTRVGISRGVPRWGKPEGGYKRYPPLFPGKWFNSVPPQEYLDLYNTILEKLDPHRVANELEAFGPNPTMLCFESAKSIDAGTEYCHRSICAQWLEDTIGLKVEEVGHPNLKRFGYLRGQHVKPPTYGKRAATDLLDLMAAG